MNSMTYADLLVYLKKLTLEQLSQNISIYDWAEDEFRTVEKIEETVNSDVVDDGQITLILN